MRYATLNIDGTPNAFYDSDIHKSIPKEAIKITNNQWLECINNQGCRAFVDGQLVEYVYQKTAEQVKAEIESTIQNMLDTKAKELRYDNMMSARSYAGYANPFQAEAQALAVWCANCWIKAGELEAIGTPMTVEEVLAQMPVFGV